MIQIWLIRTLYTLGHNDWLRDDYASQANPICCSQKQSRDTAWYIQGTSQIFGYGWGLGSEWAKLGDKTEMVGRNHL